MNPGFCGSSPAGFCGSSPALCRKLLQPAEEAGLPQHSESTATRTSVRGTSHILHPSCLQRNAPTSPWDPTCGPLPRHALSPVPDAGYGFLQPAQAEMFARQQEMLRKQNLARLELENLHRQRVLGDQLALPPSLPPDHPALRSLHDIPEGHPLREELSRRSAMLVLRHNNTPLLSLNHQGAAGSSAPRTRLAQELPQRGHGRGTRTGASRRGPGTSRGRAAAGRGGADRPDEEMKDSESDAEAGEELPKADGHGLPAELCQGKEAAKACEGAKEPGEVSGRLSAPCSSVGAESPATPLRPGAREDRGQVPGFGVVPPLPALPAQTFPFGFPYTSPYLHTALRPPLGRGRPHGQPVPGRRGGGPGGGHQQVDRGGGLRLRGQPGGCAEYTQVFREQAIDGETLPLLTEEHLLNNMGLKLGPALKIRSQVARRIGRILCMTSFPLAFPLPPSALRPRTGTPCPWRTGPLRRQPPPPTADWPSAAPRPNRRTGARRLEAAILETQKQ
ncbi:hypothetical protein ANANG_G00227360 [Anguilla anguilla]|uniref:SAM domain-containing protein n=1 Tax=Anguilla anguilla TaxID=7936 RepID=A0A9D3M4Z6_ANGAN|nr:hypothetical protein ANANG_G00227360 [Anguilla anguilla]